MIDTLNVHYTSISTIIYILVATALTYAAITDLKSRIIKNKTSLYIVGLFLIFMAVNLLIGAGATSAILIPLATAGFVLLMTSSLFAFGMMGGGDVKLMSSFALFAGIKYLLPFLLYTTVCGGIVAIGTLIYHQYFKVHEKKPKLATIDMSSDIYLATIAHDSINTEKKQDLSKPYQTNTQPKVPYGLAISAVGIWVLLQRFVELTAG
jgi:prepilin peptidase CpaA